MDTELLKTFMEVSRTRHFGRAAENLYLTQSAVSFRIRQLEGLLGVELFSRQRNNIQLTPAGEKLMPLAENSVLLEQRIRQEIAESSGKKQQLSVGSTPNLWDSLLPNLDFFMASLPGISLTALSHSNANLIRQVIERTLDLVFVLDAPKVDELTSVEVTQMPLALVSSVHYDNWQDAFGSGYVQVDWGVAFYLQLSAQVKLSKAPVLQTNTGRIALEYLLKRDGAAYLPLALIEDELKSGVLQRVEGAPEFLLRVFASFHSASGKEGLINNVLQQFEKAELLDL
ncbi:MAG: LysR family transcriptional regulator [Venatoribacter sp.]